VVIGQFVYGRSHRERSDAVPIDPLELKLAATTYRTALLGGV
jgi:serine/threonine-protein kinase HipA